MTTTAQEPPLLRYSTAETAIYVRHLLKTAFPKQKFSVRSHVYAGGSSIYVQWVDGPTVEAVEAQTDPLEGAGFDGMQDMKYFKYRYVDPAGKIVSVEHRRDIPQGRTEVQFGVDYIQCSRRFSRATVTKVCADVCRAAGCCAPEIGGEDDNAYPRMSDSLAASQEIRDTLHKTDFRGDAVA